MRNLVYVAAAAALFITFNTTAHAADLWVGADSGGNLTAYSGPAPQGITPRPDCATSRDAKGFLQVSCSGALRQASTSSTTPALAAYPPRMLNGTRVVSGESLYYDLHRRFSPPEAGRLFRKAVEDTAQECAFATQHNVRSPPSSIYPERRYTSRNSGDGFFGARNTYRYESGSLRQRRAYEEERRLEIARDITLALCFGDRGFNSRIPAFMAWYEKWAAQTYGFATRNRGF